MCKSSQNITNTFSMQRLGNQIVALFKKKTELSERLFEFITTYFISGCKKPWVILKCFFNQLAKSIK